MQQMTSVRQQIERSTRNSATTKIHMLNQVQTTTSDDYKSTVILL